MKKYQVGVIGATGMVGQRFLLLLENHPWFEVAVLAASSRSAGKPYAEAVGSKWSMTKEIPEKYRNMIVADASADVKKIAGSVDFVFCAVDMKKDEIKALEELYAKNECPVISNNSANRFTPDVPMIVPEINPEHAQIIPYQKKRLGTKRGFIAVKSNCSLQSYVPALHPLRKFGLNSHATRAAAASLPRPPSSASSPAPSAATRAQTAPSTTTTARNATSPPGNRFLLLKRYPH